MSRRTGFTQRKFKPQPYETIRCSTEEATLTNEDDIDVEGVVTTCSRCGYEVESYGTGPRSRRRNYFLLAEECREQDENDLGDGVRHDYIGGGDGDET
jgi:hypothetical protein